MLKILFIGDICGKIGRKTVAKLLPKIKKEEKIDLVIANAENSAHGTGATEDTLKELQKAGVDCMTMGDHSFTRVKQIDIYKNYPIIRPANFATDLPGTGYTVISKGDTNILLINLIGRVFMKMDHECPFRKLDEILANPSLSAKNFSAIIIDIHAEATSEKISMGHYADGRVSAVLGTHTHIMTRDEKITKKGMAYITDVGMAGAADGCLGIDKENIIKTFLTQIKYPHVVPEKGRAIFNAVILEIDKKTAKTKSIEAISKFVEIK